MASATAFGLPDSHAVFSMTSAQACNVPTPLKAGPSLIEQAPALFGPTFDVSGARNRERQLAQRARGTGETFHERSIVAAERLLFGDDGLEDAQVGLLAVGLELFQATLRPARLDRKSETSFCN